MVNFYTFDYDNCGYYKNTDGEKQYEKGGELLVNDVIWKLFSQTGNIETYLLLKEIESDSPLENVTQYTHETDQTIKLETDL